LQLIEQLQKQLNEYQSVLPKLLDERKQMQQDAAGLQGRLKQQTEELRRSQRQKQQLEELCRALRVSVRCCCCRCCCCCCF
jgi:predicted transcriptional regulator